jgi:hypothetical protein
MKKSKKKPAAHKPAKPSGSLTKTTKKGRVELGEEELSRVAGGQIEFKQKDKW